ncbi:hypothetical protein WOSG25_110200 [Weissella oryzae SG25]|uniref:Uncharacterized protein n=1 Tax=Weissella oryzae (strain DSM 25784 / JCM 18191 / LMG 30913 / SG25) TaxID=1329250 RepID=A0A069CVX3_WEIOS|nr:hypothetical protein [Weissella oryzae]GAK31542.1 hypothetical protein WOSG25_110200 [Weissella oryzae SG25]
MKTSKSPKNMIFTGTIGLMLIVSIVFIVCGVNKQSRVNIIKNQNKVNKTSLVKAQVAATPVQNSAEEAVTTFFTVLHTYKDQASYNNRTFQVKDISAENVYKDSKLFAPDNYHQVAQLNLTSTSENVEFIPNSLDGNKVSGSVIDKYAVQTGDNDKRSVQMIYSIDYDASKKKITNVQIVGQFNLSADSTLF